ncbi:Myosin light chain kinase, smooth muscle [Acipenser ruthenus]|uniref:Myosin light chain kinase, smooth muscle n=1 Tax=Acipenser ruthenus TaxID=7906 RepID=A0A662Z012_ACIRT|nr:Myosin light chain kinase, smooth muscle [Acipenser ruthenus]
MHSTPVAAERHKEHGSQKTFEGEDEKIYPQKKMADDFSKQFLEDLDEERTNAKPYFSTVIKDVEVVEGSAARFDCKIEGNFSNPEVLMLYILEQ